MGGGIFDHIHIEFLSPPGHLDIYKYKLWVFVEQKSVYFSKCCSRTPLFRTESYFNYKSDRVFKYPIDTYILQFHIETSTSTYNIKLYIYIT